MCDGWLETLLGWVCGGFAAILCIALCWVFLELHRKWRSIPELCGLDWLDIVYRLESQFGVTLTATDFENLPSEKRTALTAGQLWRLVESKLRAAEKKVPSDGWDRVVASLAEALNVKQSRIASDSRLYADLEMKSGIDI